MWSDPCGSANPTRSKTKQKGAARPPQGNLRVGRIDGWSPLAVSEYRTPLTERLTVTHPPQRVRCDVSFMPVNDGPLGPTAMRQIEARSRWQRHDASGPTPSAHEIALLMGDT